jgi:hypothetical protein
MKQYTELLSSHFEDIKQNFDSAYSYLVFEKVTDEDDRSSFKDIIAFISQSKKGYLEHDLLYDEGDHKITLVVKLALKQKEKIIQNLLMLSLSKGMNFYMYDPP